MDFFNRQIFFTCSKLTGVGSDIEFGMSISYHSDAIFTPQTT